MNKAQADYIRVMFGVMARAAAGLPAGKETPPFSKEEKSRSSRGFLTPRFQPPLYPSVCIPPPSVQTFRENLNLDDRADGSLQERKKRKKKGEKESGLLHPGSSCRKVVVVLETTAALSLVGLVGVSV